MSFALRPLHLLVVPAFALGACGTDSSDEASAGDTTQCPPSGEYGFVCGVQNGEDLVLVPGTNWVISSSMVPGAPIYLIDSETKRATSLFPAPTARMDFDTDTFQTCPGEPDTSSFITHGLNIREGRDESLTLYAVAHGERETIEVFDVDVATGTPVLTWVGCVLMPEGLEANSVASLDDGSLVATVLIHPEYTFADAMAGRPTGAIYEWSPDAGGDFTRIDGTELSSTNGIEVSADGSEIYSASSGLQTVVAFDRSNPSRQLRTTTTLPIIPDNIHMGPDGNLITAGTIVDEPACGGMPEPSEFDIEAYAACPRGFMALSIDPETMQSTTLAQGSANAAFSNATMALQVGDEVWVGTFAGDRIGYVTLD
jgi:hypothetical protein